MKSIFDVINEKLTLNKQSKMADTQVIQHIITNIINNKIHKCPKISENKYFLIELSRLRYNNYRYDYKKEQSLIFNSDYIFEYYTDTLNIEKIILLLIYKLYGNKYNKALLCVYDENEHNSPWGIAEFNYNINKTTWDLELDNSKQP